ncbi:hypothetical protein HDF16_004032 [Granulicella aggregans]|uniref:TonB-dependent transporter Oar-like beta-barrel domain-containing protein n=1 Tax=Granulicella aggregans TaxID=474949 RepID=A0A7W7ZGQ9_9BACT|nr:hypothetical protein [Granulicella aggregans]MBB5059309.1 hypothetical protein [Granulicella aggregans]
MEGSHTFAGDGQTSNPNEPAACLTAAQAGASQPLCFGPGAGQTRNTAQLRPYFASRGWTQDLTYYHDGFDTHYNGLQITIDKHFSHGLQMTANYAWQRAHNYGGDYQEIDRKVNYGRYDDLREQQLTIFSNYDLPFGKNKMFGSRAPGFVDYIIGGFSLGSSLNYSGGLPFTPSYGECGSDIPAGPCMPNKIGSSRLPLNLTGFNPGTHTRSYFTPVAAFGNNGSTSGAFQRPALDNFGTVGRNSYFGPDFFNLDLSLIKNIRLYEGVTGQFRMDAFNALNHINPGNPSSSCIDCSVGSNAGVITGEALGAAPRQLQFAARINF